MTPQTGTLKWETFGRRETMRKIDELKSATLGVENLSKVKKNLKMQQQLQSANKSHNSIAKASIAVTPPKKQNDALLIKPKREPILMDDEFQIK